MALSATQEGQEMKLKAWSHSRLVTFEKCKYWADLAYNQKIPEPERPLPEGKTEHANDRGTRLHEAAEMFTKGGVELLPELAKHFKDEHYKLRDMHGEGRVSTEGEWGFTKDWEPVAWMSSNTWVRIKCDTVAFIDKKTAVVIDFKSGKRWGNEIKHGEQMQLYVLGSLLRYPELEKVTTELWYWDINELASMTYTRDQGMRLLKNFNTRGEKITSCEEFPPNPNIHSCKWCPYKPVERGGTGHCKVGV